MRATFANFWLSPAAVDVMSQPVQKSRSPWPVHAIWRFNTDPDAPKPAMAAEDVIVLREELDPAPHLLTPGGGAFVAALLTGETLGAAHEAALTDTPDFDLSSTLALLIGTGAITALKD